MGTRSSYPEENKRNLNNSINGVNSGLSVMKLNPKEKKAIELRYSSRKADDKELRKEYFRILSTKNKKENEERLSRKVQNSYGRVSVIRMNEPKKELSYEEYSEFSHRCSMNLNHSYVEQSVNLSRDESSVNIYLRDLERSGNSRYSTPKKKSIELNRKSAKETLLNRSNYSRGNSSRYSDSPQMSLSDVRQNELPVYGETRHSLFLENDIEINPNDVLSVKENSRCNLIELKKRRSIRENNLSSNDCTMYRGGHIESDNKEMDNGNLGNFFNSSMSMLSIRNQATPNNDYELKYVKNGEELRRSYIAKLIYKKIWQPAKKKKSHNSLIIFDWDDTLLCTSFLTPNGLFNEDILLSDKDNEKIAKLEFCVLRLLTAAIDKGDTYIVTNAAPGWVEYSTERFYPSVKKCLEKITIISARGDYEAKYPGDSRMWKIQAFLNMEKFFNYNLVTNIICLGDSFIEMEAGHVLASKFTHAFIKTIKFRESPKPEELNKQLSLVADQFAIIYSTIKNLTIRVEKKVKR